MVNCLKWVFKTHSNFVFLRKNQSFKNLCNSKTSCCFVDIGTFTRTSVPMQQFRTGSNCFLLFLRLLSECQNQDALDIRCRECTSVLTPPQVEYVPTPTGGQQVPAPPRCACALRPADSSLWPRLWRPLAAQNGYGSRRGGAGGVYSATDVIPHGILAVGVGVWVGRV